MNRVMLSVVALMVTSLMAGTLYAGEAEKEAANKFLAAQTEVNESILGDQNLNVRMIGQDVGKMTLLIEKGEYEGKACYLIVMRGEISLGVKTNVEGKSYIAPDMTLLHGEQTELLNGELNEHELYEVKDGVITATFKKPNDDDESQRETSHEIKAQPGLLLASAEILVTMLLPQEAGVKYEFLRWDSKVGKTYPMEVEAAGKEEIGGKEAFKIIQHEKKFEEDELGNINSTDAESTLWLDGHKLVHMDSAEGFGLTILAPEKRTSITRDQIAKQGTAVHSAAGFFVASNERDKKLLGALINELKFVRASLDTNEMTKGMSDAEKDQIAEMYKDTLVDNILGEEKEKSDDDVAREKAVTELLLKEENFISEVKDGVQTVKFSEDAAKMFGKLLFVLEKNDEDKWEIIGIETETEEEEVEDGDGDEEGGSEKGGEKDEDEDGF